MALWLHRQGLSQPFASTLGKRLFVEHLARTGALQLDSINVVDRAHYLTLWSRFGPYDRRRVDNWVYRDRVAYEYWGHEASILPIAHLPLGRRRMREFPAAWAQRAWWQVFETSVASKRRILRRLRAEGPLESAHFEADADEFDGAPPGGTMAMPKEDRRSLKILWHDGRIAVRARRHFRCVYDLAERVYPQVAPASRAALEDSWLQIGLSGNGIASEAHLDRYFTAPDLKAADRRRIIERHLQRQAIVEVRVDGVRGRCLALPEHLDQLPQIPEPRGTTLLCPFDSLLWQRRRAEELLDFSYRIEIYVPPAKRQFGYYALPILHDGRLVGRLDPKLHRERGVLEIKKLALESGFQRTRAFDRGLGAALQSLAGFAGAERIELPRPWTRLG